MTDLNSGNELFVRSLFSWYKENKRELPWRKTKDPYKIWVSEIILQQTRVEQGKSYYIRFIQKWPTVEKLAAAEEDELMKIWEGLGYYSRARNMHITARYITNDLGGKFPNNYEQLLELRGVGPYTAAAIASFAFGLPHPVVDGNVFRVLSRIMDLSIDISKVSARKTFKKILLPMMDANDPAVFNNAMMEFGALQCVAKQPDCSTCFYSAQCLSRKRNTIQDRPVKTKKTQKKTRYFNYFLDNASAGQWVRKRPQGDIWAGLYEFPLTETLQKPENLSDILPEAASKEHTHLLSRKKHILTHQLLHIHFWTTTFDSDKMKKSNFRFLAMEEIEKLSFPRALHGIFEKM